jgi:hypothetical protein
MVFEDGNRLDILIQEFRRKSGTNEIAADFFEWGKIESGLLLDLPRSGCQLKSLVLV